MMRHISRISIRAMHSLHWIQHNQSTANILRLPLSMRNAVQSPVQSHRRFSDCVFGEPFHETIFAQSAEKVLLAHRMVNELRMIYMGYTLVTNHSQNERQHSVAFITLNDVLSSREKELLIHELLCQSRNCEDAPSKIFIVDWIPPLDERVSDLMD